jgi:hypothetical protein
MELNFCFRNFRPALEFSVYQADDAAWADYKKTHNKAYKPEEENEK